MKKFLFFFIFSFFLFFSTPALAETLIVKTNADTFSNEAYPDKANGSVGSVIISNHPIFREGYLKFPFPSELNEATSIDEISLRFNVHERNYSSEVKIAIGVTSSAWDESSLTYHAAPSRWANELAVETFYLLDGWNERDLTRLFEEEVHDKTIYERWRDGDDTGFVIIPWDMVDSEAVINDFAFSFRSKEATVNTPAELEIDYTLPPAPSPTPLPSVADLSSPESVIEETDSGGETTVVSSGEINEEEDTPEPEESAEEGEDKGLSSKLSSGQIIIFVLIIGGLLLGAIIITIILLYLQQRKKQEPEEESSKKSKPKASKKEKKK